MQYTTTDVHGFTIYRTIFDIGESLKINTRDYLAGDVQYTNSVSMYTKGLFEYRYKANNHVEMKTRGMGWPLSNPEQFDALFTAKEQDSEIHCIQAQDNDYWNREYFTRQSAEVTVFPVHDKENVFVYCPDSPLYINGTDNVIQAPSLTKIKPGKHSIYISALRDDTVFVVMWQ